ncbi:abortive infection system antitoxin AbiGi family protein [Halothermothrix orenii]|uniref:Uncharacterized protein n=1 Tax=Halothermothrix orenii (strain H 168 / OCM 544 / DSM 9562) TaxID=373903 RepID=B8CWC2_HALOH|nr:abortive infection system antitoxin AbiGi family protein [Halothermothrix orenii]ACL69591.1 hypothetical protein Hore_08340 [Halothermothrix orenii H 168]
MSPGYYSNVYWHFTGSPRNIDWSKVKNPSDILLNDSPKTEEESLSVLREILNTKMLKATTREKITDNLYTRKYCSVCDIPLKDLYYHSEYYGKVAIGFKGKAVQKKFNPVLYLDYKKLKQLRNYLKDLNYTKLQTGSALSFDLLKDYIKITSFDKNPNKTFYKEREWRCIGNFLFKMAEISAIIVGKESVSKARKYLNENKYGDSIPIITWELIGDS